MDASCWQQGISARCCKLMACNFVLSSSLAHVDAKDGQQVISGETCKFHALQHSRWPCCFQLVLTKKDRQVTAQTRKRWLFAHIGRCELYTLMTFVSGLDTFLFVFLAPVLWWHIQGTVRWRKRPAERERERATKNLREIEREKKREREREREIERALVWILVFIGWGVDYGTLSSLDFTCSSKSDLRLPCLLAIEGEHPMWLEASKVPTPTAAFPSWHLWLPSVTSWKHPFAACNP